MAVNVKMGVDLGSFTSGIRQGQQVLKGLNAEMKASEAEFKATGNAEQKLTSQTKTLNSQIQVQKGIADQAQQALQAMTAAGIQPTDAAYQKLYVTMMNATAGMNNAQAALNALAGGAETAKQGADDLTNSMQGIGKKISLEQVKSGIDSITNGLESAARKAVELGKELWDMIMDSAQRADDTATMADMYGIPLERFLQMQRLVGEGMDTSVESMLTAQDKMKKGIGNNTKTVIDTLADLGLAYKQVTKTGSEMMLVTQDEEQMFWLAGQAIMNMSDAYDKEAAATALFGKSWKELKPLFDSYKTIEEYNAALESVTVNDEETIRDLAALNDAVGKLEKSWEILKDQVLGALAPALEKGALAISGLLDSLTEYLKTPEGKKMLDDLGTAVSGLFDDLGSIDPDDVVSGFTDVFNTVVDSVKWMVENKGTIESSLQAIFGVWAGLEVSSGVLTIVNLINGLNTLTGTGAAATAAGEAVGASWGSGFASAVLKAAPWLMFLYETLKPNTNTNDKLGNSELYDENGNLKKEGKAEGQTAEDQAEYNQRKAQIQAVRELTGLSDQQRKALQGFWSSWKYIMDIRAEGGEVQQHTMDAYNMYGQQLQTLFDGQEVQLNKYMEKMQKMYEGGERGDLLDLTFFNIDKDGQEIMVSLKPPKDAAEQLSKEVGTVVINGVIHFVDADGNNVGVDFGDEKGEYIGGHGRRKKANGIWSVPYDNYLAYLHKGERVMPARAVQSQSYNSNLYVESMIMNNGTDAAGLAAAMAAAQRRQMSGYGS